MRHFIDSQWIRQLNAKRGPCIMYIPWKNLRGPLVTFNLLRIHRHTFKHYRKWKPFLKKNRSGHYTYIFCIEGLSLDLNQIKEALGISKCAHFDLKVCTYISVSAFVWICQSKVTLKCTHRWIKSSFFLLLWFASF